MASRPVAEIRAKITADAREYERASNNVRQDMRGLSNEARMTTKQCVEYFNGMGLATGAVLASIGVSIQQVIQRSSNLSQAFADVKAITGATSSEMQQLSETSAGLARVFGGTQAEILRGTGELIKAGAQLQDVMNGGAEAMVTLAKAADISFKDSAEFLAIVKNSFKDGAGSFADIADLLANTANSAAADMNDLKHGFANVGTVAYASGQGVKDVATAIGMLTNNALSGQDAGTGYKVMLQNLVPSTKENIDLFKKLGLITKDNQNIFFDTTGKLKSLADIVGIMQQKFGGFTKEDNLSLFTKLFGSDASRVAMGFVEQGRAGVERFQRQLNDTTALEVAKTRADTFAGSVNKMKAELDMAAAGIGNDLIPIVRMLTDGITNTVQAWQELEPSTRSTIAAVAVGGTVFVGMTLLMRGLGAAGGFLASTYGTLTAAAGAQTAANAGLAGSQRAATATTTALTTAQTALAGAEARTTAATTAQTAANTAMAASQNAASAAATGAAAKAGFLSGALSFLGRVAGPLGFAVSALASGWAIYEASAAGAEEETRKLTAAQAEMNAELSKNPLDRTIDDVKSMEERKKKLEELVKQHDALMTKMAEAEKRLAFAKSDNGQVSGGNPAKERRAIEELEEQIAALEQEFSKLNVTSSNAKDVLAKYTDEIKKSVPAQLDAIDADVQEVASKQTKIKRLEELQARYNQLSKAQQLNAQEIAELRSVSEELQSQIPSLIVEVDNEGRAHISNIGILGERISTEKELVKVQADAFQNKIKMAKTSADVVAAETEAVLRSLKLQAEAYASIADARNQEGNLTTNEARRIYGAAENANIRAAQIANDGNRWKSVENRINDNLARVQRGDFSSFGAAPSKPFDYDPYAEDEKKKKSEDDKIGEEYQKRLEAARHAYTIGQTDHMGYIGKLRAIESEFSDWLAGEQSERFKLREEIAKESASYSFGWIEENVRRMQQEGKAESAIANFKIASFRRVAANAYLLAEDRKRAEEEVQRAISEHAEASYRENRENLEAEMSLMREKGATAKQITEHQISYLNAMLAAEHYAADQRKQLEADVKKAQLQLRADSFQESVTWIDDYQTAARRAGVDELEIAKNVYDAWKRVTDRKTYNVDDQKKAAEELANAEVALFEAMAESLRNARQADSDLQLEQIRKDGEAAEKAIQDQIDALERRNQAEKYAADLAKERLRLSDLQAQRDRVAADLRFEIIEKDAQGNLVKRRVADLAELDKIDKEMKEQRDRIAEMEKAEVDRQERERLEKQLQETRDANEKKMAAHRSYWDRMLSEEQINSDLRKLITENGMKDTVTKVEEYLNKAVAAYVEAQNKIIEAGGLIPPVATPGTYKPSSPAHTSIDDIKAEMRRNSEAWSRTTDQAERDRLHQDNLRLGSQIGGKYDSRTGTWTFHTGVDRVPGATGADVPGVTLQAGERVFSTRQNQTFERYMEQQLATGPSLLRAESRLLRLLGDNGATRASAQLPQSITNSPTFVIDTGGAPLAAVYTEATDANEVAELTASKVEERIDSILSRDLINMREK